jgi:hypothetical protein
MSYVRKYHYKIEPVESYKVIRNCSGCGCKSFYFNTNNFRVNANGSKIDIWLIYQCEECKHTLNLSIYERVKPEEIEKSLYESFLSNDIKLSNRYGLDKTLFSRNKAIIDEKKLDYRVEAISHCVGSDTDKSMFQIGDIIEIENRYDLKARTDKIVADILNISRTKVQRLERCEVIKVVKEELNKRLFIWVNGEVGEENIKCISN